MGRQFTVLIIFSVLATACMVYSQPREDRSNLRKGTKVKIEIPKVPDEEGVIHKRTRDSLLIFFDRAPGQKDMEWYALNDDRIRVHNQLLSVLAGTAVVISSTFLVATSLATILLPFLIII